MHQLKLIIKGLIFIFTLSSFQISYSQSTSKTKSFFRNMNVQYGYHRGQIDMQYLKGVDTAKSHYHDLSFLWQTDGKKEFHQLYKFPEIGFSAVYGDFGTKEIGRAVALYPCWSYDIFRKSPVGFVFRFGSGLAWANSSYNRLNSNKNMLLGSKLLNVTSMLLNIRFNILHNLILNFGYSRFHFSNGHTQVPNYGLNDHCLNVGLKYKINRTEIKINEIKPDSLSPLKFIFRPGIGFHEYAQTKMPIGGPTSTVFNSALLASYLLNKVHCVNIGLGATYYNGYYDYMRLNDYFTDEEIKKSFVFSAIAGHKYIISHFAWVTDIEYKFYNPLAEFTTFVVRISVNKSDYFRYHFTFNTGFEYYIHKYNTVKNNLFVGMYIKTTGERADYIYSSLGFCF